MHAGAVALVLDADSTGCGSAAFLERIDSRHRDRGGVLGRSLVGVQGSTRWGGFEGDLLPG